MNRIAHLTGDDYLTLLENLERAGAVKFAEPPQRLVRLGDIGGSQLPFTPDYSHNVAGVGTLRGCETPEEERTVLPINYAPVDYVGPRYSILFVFTNFIRRFAPWVARSSR